MSPAKSNVVIVCLVVSELLALSCSTAFVLQPATSPILLRQQWRTNQVLQKLSDNSNNMNSNDEIAKLIGKRSQIKRSKKKEESIEDRLVESTEPTVDLDLDKLPEFKTERPVRRRKSEIEESDSTDDEQATSKKSASASAPIIDYMADYEDENDFHIVNRIGVSSVAWGDPNLDFMPTSSKKLSARAQKAGKFVAGDVQLAITKLLENGVTLLETSSSYGKVSKAQKLSAQHILQRSLAEIERGSVPEPCIIETSTAKLPSIWRPSASLGSILEQSLEVLNGDGGEESDNIRASVDLFVATHARFFPIRFLAAGLAAQIESGQAERVGIRTESASAIRKLAKYLENNYECNLAAASFDFSLTNPKNEPLIQVCKECNVIPLVTDPLHGGLASGVFTATNPSGGGASMNAKFSFKELEKLQPLHSVQETLTERVRTRVRRNLRDTQERFKSRYGPPREINTDITTSQIAIAYIIAKGGVPLVPVNNPAQAEERILGCLGWQLEEEEVAMLDSAIALCKIK